MGKELSEMTPEELCRSRFSDAETGKAAVRFVSEQIMQYRREKHDKR